MTKVPSKNHKIDLVTGKYRRTAWLVEKIVDVPSFESNRAYMIRTYTGNDPIIKNCLLDISTYF